MDKGSLELIKVVSLAVIAISSVVIALRMGNVANYLYDLVIRKSLIFSHPARPFSFLTNRCFSS